MNKEAKIVKNESKIEKFEFNSRNSSDYVNKTTREAN